MSPFRSTTYAVTTSSDIDRLLIDLIVQLEGKKNVVSIKNDQSTSCCQTTTNHFAGTTQSQTSVGLVASLQSLALADATLTEEQRYQVTSWLQSVDQSILTLLRLQDSAKRAALANQAKQFIKSVDAHLFSKDQTVLVGDAPSLADIVVAVSIGAWVASSSSSSVDLPQQAFRFTQTILQKLHSLTNHATIKQYASKLKEGTASPLEKPLEKPADSAAVAAGAATDNAIVALLQQHKIDYKLYDHPLCMTAEELVANVPIPTNHSHTKNLFLRDKKHGHFLVTVHPETTVNVKELGKQLNLQGKTNLRLADEKILDEKLHVKPGCVGPLAAGPATVVTRTADETDKKDAVLVVIDKRLLDCDMVHSHPLRNDQSVQLKPQALLDYLNARNVEPVLLEFAPSTTPEGGKAPASRPAATKQQPQKQKQAKQPNASKEGGAKEVVTNKKSGKKGETLLALQWKKSENFPMWYSDVIVLSEMISYYDISGCYILRPWSYKMWELIQQWFNVEIEKMGVENAYFPLFVSQDRLEKEKDHVEGFAPEVAWVTKSGSGDLALPIAVRPTSETIMYPAYSDWIRSHRDLPLKLNQWSNVVRWEFKYPTPFLRTREFLWQEGHTAHATFEEADETVMQALELYRGVYEDLLAVPVVPGYKTEAEKFAGGYRTTTVEAYIAGSGRAIQGATSHNLGQNFGKMFDIKFQDEKGESQVAWQTSWGLTTRTIGVMVMVHGDDQGLVLPPRVAPVQVVIVPIISKRLTTEQCAPYCKAIFDDLKQAGVRVKLDDREMYNPGWKYNHWEQKGVPIRVEVGPKDMENKCARIVVRHNGAKEDLSVNGLGAVLAEKLTTIQSDMFEKAKQARDSHIVQVTEWKDFVPNLEQNNLVLTPWCGGEHEKWEDWVKTTSREESLKARGEEAEDEKTATSVAAKTLCIPFKQPELPAGTKCIASGLDATCWVLWGRSY